MAKPLNFLNFVAYLIYMGAHVISADDLRQVMEALRTIVQELRVSSARLQREHGLSGAQLFVLQQLAESPAASVNALAERTHTHQSSVSTVIRRLARRRLVRLEPGADDARTRTVRLTPAGEALLAHAPRTAQATLVAALDRLDPGTRCAMARGLTAWLAAAGLTGAPAPFFFERNG